MSLIGVKWDITGRCNLSCRHCMVGTQYSRGKAPGELSTKERVHIVDKLADGGVSALSFLGGEPLILGDDLLAIIRRSVFKGLKTTVVTNGTLLTPDHVGKLAATGLDCLVISLDGPTAEANDATRGKGVFDRVVANIRGLKNYVEDAGISLEISINTVLTKRNYLDIDKMVDLCLYLGVDEWTLLSLSYTGFAGDHFSSLALTVEEELEATKAIAQRISYGDTDSLRFSPNFVYPLVSEYVSKEYGWQMPMSPVCCYASTGLGFIDPNGDMFPCDRVLRNNYLCYWIGNVQIRAFNLLEHSFFEIWNSDFFVNMFQLISDVKTYKHYVPCNHCKYLSTRFCNPCPLYSLDHEELVFDTCLYAEQALGDISGPDTEEHPQEELLPLGREPQAAELQKIKNKYPYKRWGIRCFESEYSMSLFNPYTSERTNLNLMGKEIWKLIDGTMTAAEMAAKVSKIAAEVKEALAPKSSLHLQLDTETLRFIHSLHQRQIIELRESSSL